MSGGITNWNFLIRDGTERYVARISPRASPARDRPAQRGRPARRPPRGWASGPNWSYREDGILVSRYVPGRTLTAGATSTSRQTIAQRCAALRDASRCRQARSPGISSTSARSRRSGPMPDTAKTLEARLPANLPGLLDDARDACRARRSVSAGPVPQRPAAGQPDRRRPSALAGQTGSTPGSATPCSTWPMSRPTRHSPTIRIKPCCRLIALWRARQSATSPSCESSRPYRSCAMLSGRRSRRSPPTSTTIYHAYARAQVRDLRPGPEGGRLTQGRTKAVDHPNRVVVVRVIASGAAALPSARPDRLFTSFHETLTEYSFPNSQNLAIALHDRGRVDADPRGPWSTFPFGTAMSLLQADPSFEAEVRQPWPVQPHQHLEIRDDLRRPATSAPAARTTDDLCARLGSSLRPGFASSTSAAASAGPPFTSRRPTAPR